MKSLVLLITLSVSAAFACPGGHLKDLAIKKGRKDVVVAQIDMISNTVTASKGSETLQVMWQASDKEVIEIVCGTTVDKACRTQQGLDYKLLENRNGKLYVTAYTGKKSFNFTVTNFGLARGIPDPKAACTTVYPDSN